MQRDIITCDRCGSDTQGHRKIINFEGEKDLCVLCFDALKSWMSRDNATVQGDINRPRGLLGPGWREVCSHHIPCAGPCPQPRYERV